MIKDENYYLNLDLELTAGKINSDRLDKGDDNFTDLIFALIFRLENEVITKKDIISYIGKPDFPTEDEDLLEYKEIGFHCENKFKYVTNFMFKNNRLVKIEPSKTRHTW